MRRCCSQGCENAPASEPPDAFLFSVLFSVLICWWTSVLCSFCSVLHQELAAAKSRMAEFVQLLQRQQQPGGSATAATAACVRVK
jgi:hypothetical protein